MEQLVAAVVLAARRVGGEQVTVLVEVGGVVQLGPQAPFLVRHPEVRRELERPERSAEPKVLLVRDVLVADHDDGELGHRLFDVPHEVSRWLDDEVGALDLGGEHRMELTHGEFHVWPIPWSIARH